MRTLAVAHSCILVLALLTPFTLSPSVDVFFAFRMLQTANMCYYIHEPIRNSRPCSKALRCRVFSFADPGMTCLSPSNVSSILRRCIFVSATLRIFNLSFTLDPLLHLFWTANTLAIGNFCKCNNINSCWPKLPYGFGVDLTISGCGLFSRSTPINPTFGPWNRP